MIQWQNSENIKVNNINTSAIMEDADSVLTYFADKYIITKYPISTGDIIQYAGITYIVISQIDRNYESRDESQYTYRARIRQADFSIKIVIDGKLEEFPCIVEGQKFDVVDNQMLTLSDDKIIVVAKDEFSIKKKMRFIKMGNAWEIVGIDKTRQGLVSLFCDVDLVDPANDDMENEIADVDLIDNEEPEPEPNGDYEIVIDIPETIIFGESELCTVEVLVDGIEVDDEIEFEQSGDIDKIWIEDISDRTCYVRANNDFQVGALILKVFLVDNPEVYAEKRIVTSAW